MTTTQPLEQKCGHGLTAWKIDGYHYHERKDQDAAIDGTRMRSGGLQVDVCDRPAELTTKRVRR